MGIVHQREQIIGCDTGNGLFARGVDGQEDDLIELRQHFGKMLGEVAGAAVQVGLEHAADVLVRVYFPHGGDEGVHLFGMVRVIINVDEVFAVHDVVEAPLHAGECLQFFADEDGA